ncbi:MAG TPA: NAD(P)-binding domain-containing protein, partial [Terriglobia bacterium]|nr:NAD(P)-binding domain-containing protein [Terriglobia bacterium]
MIKGKKLAVLGAGKMGETLISGMLDVGIIARDRIVATAKHDERLEPLKEKYKIAVTTNNRK